MQTGKALKAASIGLNYVDEMQISTSRPPGLPQFPPFQVLPSPCCSIRAIFANEDWLPGAFPCCRNSTLATFNTFLNVQMDVDEGGRQKVQERGDHGVLPRQGSHAGRTRQMKFDV